MSTRAKVYAGACGFTSVIKAKRRGNEMEIKIISACKMLQKMNDDLELLDWRRNLFINIQESVVYRSANKHLMHTDCPVPSAIIKTIQIELDGMVPTDVSMKFERVTDEDI
jgi:hypothetical protein